MLRADAELPVHFVGRPAPGADAAGVNPSEMMPGTDSRAENMVPLLVEQLPREYAEHLTTPRLLRCESAEVRVELLNGAVTIDRGIRFRDGRARDRTAPYRWTAQQLA